MKNKTMIAAWDQIMPDAGADARMRSQIMAYQRSWQAKKRTIRMKRVMPIAACLALAAAGTTFWAIRQNGFGAKDFTVTLAGGEQLVYPAYDQSAAQLAADSIVAPYAVTSRDLTADEIAKLCPLLEKTADDYMFGYFKDETGELVRMEGKIGGIKICAANADLPVTDTVITGHEAESELCGVTVNTAYTVMRPNSKGIRTAVFCAEFAVDGIAIHAELAGDENNSRQICEQLSEAVYCMIQTHAPALSAVHAG